jgi:hypothetical protein
MQAARARNPRGQFCSISLDTLSHKAILNSKNDQITSNFLIEESINYHYK